MSTFGDRMNITAAEDVEVRNATATDIFNALGLAALPLAAQWAAVERMIAEGALPAAWITILRTEGGR